MIMMKGGIVMTTKKPAAVTIETLRKTLSVIKGYAAKIGAEAKEAGAEAKIVAGLKIIEQAASDTLEETEERQ